MNTKHIDHDIQLIFNLIKQKSSSETSTTTQSDTGNAGLTNGGPGTAQDASKSASSLISASSSIPGVTGTANVIITDYNRIGESDKYDLISIKELNLDQNGNLVVK